ncbi:FtsX-like permease family protein [Anaerosacchariphilus polymeriproducens]|uniref:ABC transporter permease n=1 Tax=Anaerosacchariphilus polymeriproducens TaxID=1812858 RepID=A0A371AVP1_9FIRM|nr:FtsX-like permease family protein [Anaerosacchariphilus polymeriproducens]RDU23637.1 ABC transporter permease [Anaerosacchariphilus polymeriproducens]
MFFKLVRKNSKRSRKENGLFFLSLIVSIVAFYIILSLKNQDVIIFLRKMESDAVNHLFMMIPVLYGVSLFILFFLVYFSGKYQLDRRNHQLGIYMMMGMRRTRLLLMLLAEEIWSSVLSLAVGIPVAVFISEMISLITARVVGLGIIGHRFTFSIYAIFWTAVGYFAIRLLALAILSGNIVKKEIGQLLYDSQEEKQRIHNRSLVLIQFTSGILLLAAAYGMAISGISWNSISGMIITIIIGISGTFLLFYGIGILFEMFLKKRGTNKGLGIFTFRQLQETVFLRPNSLAISSLLVLMALCFFGYGISVGFGSDRKEQHVLDYTFQGDEKQIKTELEKINFSDYTQELFEVRTGYFSVEQDDEDGFSAESLISALKRQNDSNDEDIIFNYLQYFTSMHLISLSGYNHILELAGKEPIKMNEYQVALYRDPEFSDEKMEEVVKDSLLEKPYVEIKGKQYQLIEKFCQDDIVVDRAISIGYGLVVSDDLFERLTNVNYSSYWNAALKKEIVKSKGLLQAISQVNDKIDQTSLKYESYLQNMGRKLFYLVASSYTTIYLAVIFLIIANTVIGVQFLMQQHKTGKRYRTLINLGCHYEVLCHSARRQIKWYFGLPVTVAAIGSLFGVKSLFTGILVRSVKDEKLLFVAAAIIVSICVIELIYMTVVMKLSDKYLLELIESRQEDN